MIKISYVLWIFSALSLTKLVLSVANPYPCVNHPPILNRWRLPRTYKPVHYNIKIQPFLDPNVMTFIGKVSMQLTCLNATDHVYLNLYNLTITTMEVIHVETREKMIIKHCFNFCSRQSFAIHVYNRFEVGEKYSIDITYKGEIGHLTGLYQTHYEDELGIKRYAVATQFQATDARKVFPCFDEPDARATYNVSLIHLRNMTALSNMPVRNVEDIGVIWKRTNFIKSLPMSSDTLAFFVGPFEKSQFRKYTIYTEPNYKQATEYALIITPKILARFQILLKIKCDIPKLDQIALSHTKREGMENWAMMAYHKSNLLHYPGKASTKHKEFVFMSMANKISGQWFGNLVTSCWWDSLFLTKGFAEFFQYVGMIIMDSAKQPDTMIVQDSMFSMMYQDLYSKHAQPIIKPVSSPSEIESRFGYYSYTKAAAFIRMILYHMGKEDFMYGVKDYLIQNRQSCAVPQDLYNSWNKDTKKIMPSFNKPFVANELPEYWEDNSDEDTLDSLLSISTDSGKISVDKFGKSWTIYTGHPIVEVVRNYNAKSATVTQTHVNSEALTGMFYIPLTYTNGRERKYDTATKLLLKTDRHEILNISESRDWVLFNPHVTGLYNVNYDMQNWELLVKALMTEHEIFPAINRAQILSDLWTFSKTDPQYLRLFMNATRFLYFEQEEPAWSIFLDVFRALLHIVEGDDGRKQTLIEYAKTILAPVYKFCNWDNYKFKEKEDKESHLNLRNRITYLLCALGHNHCKQKAKQYFSRWKKNGQQHAIPVDFKFLAYCYGLSSGDLEDWHHLTEYAKTQTYFEETNRIKEAFKCGKRRVEFDKHLFVDPKEIEKTLKNVTEYYFQALYEMKCKDSSKASSKGVERLSIDEFYYRSSFSDNIYDFHLAYDLDHKHAEKEYFNLFHDTIADGHMMAMREFLDDWENTRTGYFENIKMIRSRMEVKKCDSTFTLMDKLLT